MIKLKAMLKEGIFTNQYGIDQFYGILDYLNDKLEGLDDILDDDKTYKDRTVYRKLTDSIDKSRERIEPEFGFGSQTPKQQSTKPDIKDVQNNIDAVVKFYENAMNKKVKTLLADLGDEASQMKSKLK
jgi:hypothetical protein